MSKYDPKQHANVTEQHTFADFAFTKNGGSFQFIEQKEIILDDRVVNEPAEGLMHIPEDLGKTFTVTTSDGEKEVTYKEFINIIECLYLHLAELRDLEEIQHQKVLEGLGEPPGLSLPAE